MADDSKASQLNRPVQRWFEEHHKDRIAFEEQSDFLVCRRGNPLALLNLQNLPIGLQQQQSSLHVQSVPLLDESDLFA